MEYQQQRIICGESPQINRKRSHADWGLTKHGGGHAVITVQNREGSSLVGSNKKHGTIDCVILHRVTQQTQLVKEFPLAELSSFRRMRFHDIAQVKAAVRNATPVRSWEKADARQVFRRQFNFEPFRVRGKLAPHCTAPQKQQSLPHRIFPGAGEVRVADHMSN